VRLQPQGRLPLPHLPRLLQGEVLRTGRVHIKTVGQDGGTKKALGQAIGGQDAGHVWCAKRARLWSDLAGDLNLTAAELTPNKWGSRL